MVWVVAKDRNTTPGDLLEPHRDHIRNRMFNGFDFDQTMLRIAAMNLCCTTSNRPASITRTP